MELIEARILASIAIFIIAIILHMILRRAILRNVERYVPKMKRTPLRKVLTVAILIVLLLSIISIWGLNLDNLWIYITSVMGLVAIGFVAVWSMLSNLLASTILLASRRVRIGDEIEILPDKIKGVVVNITLLFIILEEKGYRTTVPSNMFFQKFVRIKREKAKNK